VISRGTPLLFAVAVAIAGCGDGGARPNACPDVIGLQPVTGTSCRYLLPLPPSDCVDVDRAHIGVRVAGNEIVRDPNRADGWDYTDDTMDFVQVYGPSCDAITADPTLPVTVVFKVLIP
jgi:hypothetical protein